MLDRTPICPMCADVLEAHNVFTYRAVAFCTICATRARATNWPEPYAFQHVFSPPDLNWQIGVAFYSPRDNRPEAAIPRRYRLDQDVRQPLLFVDPDEHAPEC